MRRNIYGLTMPAAKVFYDRLPTPLGLSHLVCNEAGAVLLYGWSENERWRHRFAGVEVVERTDPFGLSAKLAAYFAGDVKCLDNVLVLYRGTAFQNRVWLALRSIPAGATQSYGALAARLGDPKATRAVGLANGANPIAVIVPCHRVIGAKGALTGYGGGLDRKKWLLAHEARHTDFGILTMTSP